MKKQLPTIVKTGIKDTCLISRIEKIEKIILSENRWDTWHVGGVREHLALATKDA